MITARLHEAVEEGPKVKRKTHDSSMSNKVHIRYLIEIATDMIVYSEERASDKVARRRIEQAYIILDRDRFELEKEERRQRMECSRKRSEQQE